MKKQEKIDIIQKCIEETQLCRVYFSYDNGFFFYSYPMAVSDKFILGYEEDDFILDGLFIRKISHLKKAEIRLDKCNEINKASGLTKQLTDPGIDISSWQSIFRSLAAQDQYVLIEDHISNQVSVGKIQKVLKNKLYLKRFNAKGIWLEGELEIPYSSVTSVEWGIRYITHWRHYLEEK